MFFRPDFMTVKAFKGTAPGGLQRNTIGHTGHANFVPVIPGVYQGPVRHGQRIKAFYMTS
jgi:hypothetical protein